MAGLSLLDNVGNFLQQPFDFMCIFILGAGVQDEANSFKTFNPIFILRGNTREIVVG